jgi:hypothetical protein
MHDDILLDLSWDIDHSRFPDPRADRTVSLGSGHFWPEVPETLHIGAYPHVKALQMR